MEQPPVLVVRDELWELLAKADDPMKTVEVEAAHRGLTTRQLLNSIARQARIDGIPRLARPSFVPHRPADFD
ncbi:hypothetical protein [Kitasatospora sp. NPDC088779]|uniref:hypothetical protein n=1 Tax=Kitasatospora sp. NPDC088779 TaxID=3154964 RepID=UPI0034213B45